LNNAKSRKISPLVGGIVAAVVIFGAAQLFYTIRGPVYAEPSNDPGTVTVRPIVKDDGVKNMTMSVVIALAGGVITARAIGRRDKQA
jgi:hypothetical protein